MDKLKEKLGPAIKYAFWGVWALVMIVSIAIWWVSTSSLVANAESQKTAINGAYSTLTQIRGTASTHPNPHSHTEMEKRVDILQQDVLAAWERQWEYQEKILVWPTELNKKGTSDFVDAFSKYLPIETTTEFPMPEIDQVDQTLRHRYKLYIEGQLPGLAEVVGAKWTADFKAASNAAGMGMGMGAGGMEMGFQEPMGMGGPGEFGVGPAVSKEPDTLVNWSTASQAMLLEQVFPWRTKEAPSTLDVLYSQEDLWVLKNLLQIVSTVNGNATKPFQATVHEIVEIQLGRAVAGRVGRVSRAAMQMGGDAMGMGMDMGMGSEMGMDMGMGMEMGMGSEMGMGEGGMEAVDPAENRYVNTAYEPISASELRSAMESPSPENAFLNVAKRLPVKLTLKMDQRKLPQLLTACGNARLMVEVRQVRINTSSTGAASGGMGMEMGGMGMEMGGMGMEMGGMGAGFGEMGMTGGGMPGGNRVDEYPFDLPIEVYGVIYIYNPPDLEKLGVEEVTTETVVNDQSIGEAPVANAAGTQAPATPEPAAPNVEPAAGEPPVENPPAPAAVDPPAAVPPVAAPEDPPAAAENPAVAAEPAAAN
ncbi:hypothetical protein Poly24_23000 [Rosistilla carotiformis]|uniref:Uncharacterized protein n=1 Tax=Rosistilla carotiformis TaxID=2528017 RepID=A0A518JSS5_9BACT|nr:hypothetical protein [Rosistilla carotiformis]QDV68590.1 hypothetical protein Poly24_23000 [Rosistilla carotiformis]